MPAGDVSGKRTLKSFNQKTVIGQKEVFQILILGRNALYFA